MRRVKGGVKLLGHGEFKAKVSFSVYRASQSAIQAVEKAGGSVKILAAPKEVSDDEPRGKNKRMALAAAKGDSKGGKGEGKAKAKPAEGEAATE
jgi:large subunit ribosomal protein L15